MYAIERRSDGVGEHAFAHVDDACVGARAFSTSYSYTDPRAITPRVLGL